MTICTWNCQGDPTESEEKLKVLNSLIGSYEVVLLQECGKMSGAKSLSHKCHSDSQAGAYSGRCSMAILTNLQVDGFNSYYQSDIGRPIQELIVGEIAIYNIHANAATGEGARTLLNMMSRKLSDGIKVVVAGGDWNRTPIDQQALFKDQDSLMIASNTFRYKYGRNMIDFQFESIDTGTQQSGLTLDYFITAGQVRSLRPQNAYNVRDIKSFCSDHIPIGVTVHKIYF